MAAPKKVPPDRDPQLREALALPDGDQLAQLRAMNGDPAVAPDQQLVPAVKPRKPRRRELQHPEERPDVSDMLTDLADATYDSGFGNYGILWHPGWRVAADAETNIYNNWVRLQCYRDKLRSPGELTRDRTVKRFE